MTAARVLGLVGALGLVLAGCEKEKPSPPPPPAPRVTVAHPMVRDVTQWDEYAGRLEAVEVANVVARVSGYIEAVDFTEGALVKKGALLFTIDPRMFQAELDREKAAVVQAEAKLQVARNDLARTERVAKNGSVSAEELDTRRGTVAEFEGALAEAKANEEAARLNVEWCKVTAPISGRISDRKISAGNMINGGGGQAAGTVLTTITSVDPIYCYVDIDDAAVMRTRDQLRATTQSAPVPCYMGLTTEVGFPHTGVIDFVDNQMTRTTGTRRVRGVFANPDGWLLPQSAARLRIAGQTYPNALLVIDDAVGTDQDRKYLWLMHPDKTIERKTVEVGPLIGELRVITAELEPSDLVIVNGTSNLMMVRPGGTVNATETAMPEHRLAAAAAARSTSSSQDPRDGATSQPSPATTQKAGEDAGRGAGR